MPRKYNFARRQAIAIYIWHQGVRHPTRASLRKDHAEVFHILRYMREFARE